MVVIFFGFLDAFQVWDGLFEVWRLVILDVFGEKLQNMKGSLVHENVGDKSWGRVATWKWFQSIQVGSLELGWQVRGFLDSFLQPSYIILHQSFFVDEVSFLSLQSVLADLKECEKKNRTSQWNHQKQQKTQNKLKKTNETTKTSEKTLVTRLVSLGRKRHRWTPQEANSSLWRS